MSGLLLALVILTELLTYCQLSLAQQKIGRILSATHHLTNPASNSFPTNEAILDDSSVTFRQNGADYLMWRNVTTLIIENDSKQLNLAEITQLYPRLRNLTVKSQIRTLVGKPRQPSTLRIMDLSGNRLTSLPASLSQLTSLHALNVSNNKIRGLKKTELALLLGKLRVVDISGTSLVHFGETGFYMATQD